MFTLIIETSTEKGLVALLDHDRLLYQKNFPFGYNSSAYLLPAIQEGFSSQGFKASQLSQIVCGVGPGSYTGIRMGAICAKTLAYALKIPLIGICSLKAFVPDEEGPFFVLIDAKIGGVYLLSGIKKEGKISSWAHPQLCSYSELPEDLYQSKMIVSPNYSSIHPKIVEQHPINAKWIDAKPSWKAIYDASLDENPSKEGRLDILYLRKTQAEIEKQAESQ